MLTQWGELPDGRVVHRLELGREPGVVLHLLTLGATVHRLEVAGGDGVRRNVALGHATQAERLDSTYYLGSVVGRYANRIAAGRFVLDGDEVQVGDNDRGNSLHGGPDGFDRRLWFVEEHSDDHASLVLESPDGDQGFPGRLTVRARYEVDGDEVRLLLSATTDAPTVVNLTSHVYLNLDGDGAGSIDDHLLHMDADHYTPVDDTGIPLGEDVPVDGTAFDLRRPTRLGDVVRRDEPQVVAAQGIDHNLVVRGQGLRTVAELASPRTRTRMELRSDQPSVQVYTGNQLDGSHRSSEGVLYRQGDGIALEPQLEPDIPNGPDAERAVLRPGATYRHELSWRFGRVD